MKLCLGFFGFIRILITKEHVNNFLKLLDNYDEIHVFISCPNKIGELDDKFNESEITNHFLDVFKHDKIRYVHVKYYNYNPQQFLQKSRILNLPDRCNISNAQICTYRVISCHYSISTLSEYIKNNPTIYDNIILTRFDIFPTITSLGDCITINNNEIYIWRTIPYHSETDAEDRVIITSWYGLTHLQSLYGIYNDEQSFNNLEIKEHAFYSENIIGKYLNGFNELIKKPQTNICIGMSPFIKDKYTDFISMI